MTTENMTQAEKNAQHAHDLVALYGDADMSREELVTMLTANEVDEALAQSIAADLRPEPVRVAAGTRAEDRAGVSGLPAAVISSPYAEQARMLTEGLCELRLQEFTRGDWDGWAGANKPDGFEPQIAEIKVIGLPASQVDSVQWKPEATLIVDACGITINFEDTKEEGFAYAIHKPMSNFSLAVEVAKALRPEMKFNVLIALGFLRA